MGQVFFSLCGEVFIAEVFIPRDFDFPYTFWRCIWILEGWWHGGSCRNVITFFCTMKIDAPARAWSTVPVKKITFSKFVMLPNFQKWAYRKSFKGTQFWLSQMKRAGNFLSENQQLQNISSVTFLYQREEIHLSNSEKRCGFSVKMLRNMTENLTLWLRPPYYQRYALKNITDRLSRCFSYRFFAVCCSETSGTRGLKVESDPLKSIELTQKSAW